MNKLLIINLLFFISLLAHGQVINGEMWNYLPVTSEQIQMYKGDGESLNNDVDLKNGMWTSQLYNIKKNNVEKMSIAFYSVVEKFGKPTLSIGARKVIEVAYNSDGRILLGGGCNLGLNSRIIPGGYTKNGAKIKLSDKRISEVNYSYEEKAIYEYNQDGYANTVNTTRIMGLRSMKYLFFNIIIFLIAIKFRVLLLIMVKRQRKSGE